MQLEDVCASLSASSSMGSHFWISHSIECQEMIRNRVVSHCLGLLIVFVCANIGWLYCVATLYLLCPRPRRELVWLSKQVPKLSDS
jgi:hypothetical protein